MDFRKPLPVAIAIAALIGLAILIYRWQAAEGMAPAVRLAASPDPVKPAPALEVPPEPPAKVVASHPTARAPAAAPSAPRSDRHASLLAEGMTSSDPYALVMKLRDMKALGTYAVAFEIIRQCSEAYRAVRFTQQEPAAVYLSPGEKWVDPVLAEQRPEVRAQRESARQEVIARCAPFKDNQSQLIPLEDDELGWQYAQAIVHSMRADGEAKPEGVPAAMAAQGMAWASTSVLGRESTGFAYFDGELRGGLSKSEFQQAMWQAEALATTSTEKGGRADLRLLRACAVKGDCRDSLADVMGPSLKDPEAHARVTALAQRMAAALRAGDVDRFRRKP